MVWFGYESEQYDGAMERFFTNNEYLQVPFPSDILIEGCFKTYFREIEEGRIYSGNRISVFEKFFFTFMHHSLSFSREEVQNCKISKEMWPLYFVLAVFCLFEAGVPEFTTQPLRRYSPTVREQSS
jgi:hypothetical protein